MPIKFFGNTNKHGWLSNFSEHPVMIDEIEYPTVEHYYQCEKCTDNGDYKWVFMSASPGQAKRRGKSVSIRPDWDSVKTDIMKKALEAKITQHPHLRRLLLETGTEDLVEDSPYDWYWGCGKNGTGQNVMGHLWMTIRESLKKGKL